MPKFDGTLPEFREDSGLLGENIGAGIDDGRPPTNGGAAAPAHPAGRGAPGTPVDRTADPDLSARFMEDESCTSCAPRP